MILHEILSSKEIIEDDLCYLAEQLGYANPKKGMFMLQRFIKKGSICNWLDNAMYDFKYDSLSFVKAVAEVLGVDIEDRLNEVQHYRGMRAKMDNTYIEVDVNFTRTTESIFTLMAVSSKRRVVFDKEALVDKSDEEIFEAIGLVVKKHYEETKGELAIWGKIVGYTYYHIDKNAYAFDAKGLLTRVK